MKHDQIANTTNGIILFCVAEKIKTKYSDINGSTLVVDLHKGRPGLGISLAGNRDRTKMSVFICGMHPKGSAYKDGRLKIGDEILEVSFNILKNCNISFSAHELQLFISGEWYCVTWQKSFKCVRNHQGSGLSHLQNHRFEVFYLSLCVHLHLDLIVYCASSGEMVP